LAMTNLIVNGVLERFPRLRVVFAEAGGGWARDWIEEMDEHYRCDQMRKSVPWLRMTPSEYVRRQCLICFKPGESCDGGRLSGALSAQSVAWSSDYPHYDSAFPGAVAGMRTLLTHCTQQERAAILGRNAASLFKVSVEANGQKP
jgi:uncharacterized protein